MSDQIKKKGYSPGYGDLTKLNTCRLILDTIGESTLKEITKNHINLMGTSGAIYEANGDYAHGIFSSGWCQYLDSASRELCNTDDNLAALNRGKWICHECCWNEASFESIKTREPVDIECKGGIRLYAVPIIAGGKVIGSINMGYGNPPSDLKKLLEISKRYQVDFDKLSRLADEYISRPPQIISAAKSQLITSAQLIGQIIEHQKTGKALLKTTHALGERVKELNCLYSISKLIEKDNITLDEILQGAADIIPPSWQYPEFTCARIIFQQREYKTANFKKTTWKQSQDIVAHGEPLGKIEIFYLEEQPENFEGPFLKEERDLIDSIAGHLGRDIERKRNEEALTYSKKHYQNLFHNSPVPLWEEDFTEVFEYIENLKKKGVYDFRAFFDNNPSQLKSCAQKAKIIDVNKATIELHNAENKEDLLGSLNKILNESSYNAFKEEIIALAAGQSVFEIEAEVKTLTGEVKSISLNLIIDKEQQGSIRAMLATPDITERKRMESKLRDSEERFSLFMDYLPAMAFIKDKESKTLFVNRPMDETLGAKDWIGKIPLDLFPKEIAKAMIADDKKTLAEGYQNIVETVPDKNGINHIYQTHKFKFENSEKVPFIGGIALDITKSMQAEEALKKSHQILNREVKKRTADLEDMNTALKVLLNKRENDKRETENNIFTNYKSLIFPFFQKLKKGITESNQQNLINIIESNLNEFLEPFSKKLSNPLIALTPSEIQIASMIKQGLSNKEIAQILKNSVRTINNHREHIRNKLDIKNKKINLRTFLSSL